MRVATLLAIGSVALVGLAGCGMSPMGLPTSAVATQHAQAMNTAASQLDQTQQQVKACILNGTIANKTSLRYSYVDVQNIRYVITDQAGDYRWTALGVTNHGQPIRLSGTFAAEGGEGLRVLNEGAH